MRDTRVHRPFESQRPTYDNLWRRRAPIEGFVPPKGFGVLDVLIVCNRLNLDGPEARFFSKVNKVLSNLSPDPYPVPSRKKRQGGRTLNV